MVFLGCEHSSYTGKAMGRRVHTMDTMSQDQLWEEASGSGGDSAVAYEPSSANPSAAHGGSQQRAEGQLQEGGRRDCSHSRSSLGEGRRWWQEALLGDSTRASSSRKHRLSLTYTHTAVVTETNSCNTGATKFMIMTTNSTPYTLSQGLLSTRLASVSVTLKCAGRASRLRN